MKRTDLAEIFYKYNTDPAKLNEVRAYLAKSISESVSLLFAIDPDACKDILQQLKSQLTEDVLDKQVSDFEKGKQVFIEAQMKNLANGPHLVFEDEDEPAKSNG